MTDDLDAIKADIAKARQWALDHFNAYVDEETTPSHLLAAPTALVEFPEPDTMTVCQVSYGEAVEAVTAEFKLCWKGRRLVWKGNFLLRKALFEEGNIIELWCGLSERGNGQKRGGRSVR